jgi:hypothetical protein
MIPYIKTLVAAARDVGPYLLVEILLPGGSLLALALWLYQQSHATDSHWGLASGDWGITREDMESGLSAHD